MFLLKKSLNFFLVSMVSVDDTTKHEYLYDANGNLTTDYNKQIGNVQYNYLNLPTLVDLGDENYIEYLYDAAGIKLKQKVYKDGGLQKETDYIGSFVYENSSLKFIITDEGRLLDREDGTGYDYEYFIKDHLGNNRITVADQNNDGIAEVMQADHYYPFGMALGGQSWQNPLQKALNKYLYNGKELQDDLGLNLIDYGARFYDMQLGRWHVIDNKAEKYNSFSPYVYAINNPMLFIDPDGNEIVNPNSESAQYVKAQLNKTESGKRIWQNMVDSKNSITIHVTKFLDQKRTGFAGQEGTLSKLTLDMQTGGGFVIKDNVLEKINKGEAVELSDQVEGGTFNEETGEYDFENGSDLHMVIDLDVIKFTSGDEMNIIAEEAVHTTQTYHDPGVKFKKKDPKTGKYVELTKAEVQSRTRKLTPQGSEQNYNSQRNEKEAKKEAKKVSDEYKGR